MDYAKLIESELIGKRFILAFLVVATWAALVISEQTIPSEVNSVVLAVLAFYFGSHSSAQEVS